MRIAVISDIHGNLEALKKAYMDILEKQADTIVCLGDLTGYGPYPNEVIDFIKEKRIMCILGNYDAAVIEEKFNYIRDNEINRFSMPWTSNRLTEENRAYLKALPKQISMEFEGNVVCFVHGSNRSINEYLIENSRELEEVMEEFKGDVLIYGHTHIPYQKKYGAKLAVNGGSIGKPKIGRPNGTYVILDIESGIINTELVEFQYDYEKAAKDMKERSMPEACIDSIRTGNE